MNNNRCQKCGDSNHIEGSQCPAKKFQCKSCHKYGHFTSLCYQKKQASSNPMKPKAHMLQVGAVYALTSPYTATHKIIHPVISFISFCLQVKTQHSQAEGKEIPTPSHLITNLAYKLKPHQTETSVLEQDWTLVQM